MRFIKVHPVSEDKDGNPFMGKVMILNVGIINSCEETTERTKDNQQLFRDVELFLTNSTMAMHQNFGEYLTRISLKGSNPIRVVESIDYIWEQINNR